jgi:hypothetical protein
MEGRRKEWGIGHRYVSERMRLILEGCLSRALGLRLLSRTPLGRQTASSTGPHTTPPGPARNH